MRWPSIRDPNDVPSMVFEALWKAFPSPRIAHRPTRTTTSLIIDGDGLRLSPEVFRECLPPLDMAVGADSFRDLG